MLQLQSIIIIPVLDNFALIAINLFEQEQLLMKFASCPEEHLSLASKVSRIAKSLMVDQGQWFFQRA